MEMEGLCKLVTELQGIFHILRILAFVGAGFFIATWAWGYISDPKEGKELITDIKKKGTGMLVGFFLLFIIGVILSAAVSVGSGGSIAGLQCGSQLAGGWN